MVILPSVTSLPTGIKYDQAEDGCTCHESAPSDSVTATIEGVPDSYNGLETFTLTVSFTGGPGTEGNLNVGGFNLWVSDGSLTSLDSTTQLNSPNDITHTEEGNNQRSWTVEWTAPEDNSSNVNFILHTNSVNGNAGSGAGSSGDMWNRAVATAFAVGVTQPYSAGIGGGAFLLIRLADGTVVALDAGDDLGLVGLSELAEVVASGLEVRLAGFSASGGEEEPVDRGVGQLCESFGECDGVEVRATGIAGAVGQGGHLSAGGFGQLGASVAGDDVPESRQSVDVFAAVGVDERRAV
jgi:hypothetical protein